MAGNDKKSPKPVHKDRFLRKMFLRGDSVILVVKIGGQMSPLANSCPDRGPERGRKEQAKESWRDGREDDDQTNGVHIHNQRGTHTQSTGWTNGLGRYTLSPQRPHPGLNKGLFPTQIWAQDPKWLATRRYPRCLSRVGCRG